MAKFSSIYKQTAPTRRVVQGENTYEKGMYWSNQALDAGYVHTLLNFEIDQLSHNLNIPGGLHVTDAATGCTFLDRATFGEGEANIVVLQGRNEYNLRAFEGITNIISAQRLSIKNNQTLEEKLRQQGYTADDVVCFKLLTYNPLNHRLMSVTLIQAKRDKYFTVDGSNGDYQLRRLNSNPISCGFSEVWNNGYVTNKMDYHPRGEDDYYVPRARRNSYDETFGQTLHSPLYMQTVPNCEGYGNKTFCFTKKKQVNIEGPIKNTAEIEKTNVIELTPTSLGGQPSVFNPGRNPGNGYKAGDIVRIRTKDASKTITPVELRINQTFNYTMNDVTYTGGIASATVLAIGIVHGRATDYTADSFELVNVSSTSGTPTGKDATWSLNVKEKAIISSTETPVTTVEDIYLRNINIGTNANYYSTFNNVPVPLDGFRYGILLTGCALIKTSATLPTPPVTPLDSTKLWDTALVEPVQNASAAVNNKPLFRLNLDTGLLTPTADAPSTGISIKFAAVPYINRSISGQPTDSFEPDSLFETAIIPNWGSSPASIHPSTWLRSDILQTIRKGQGFRFAAYCVSVKSPTRYLNTLREDPLESKYYGQEVTAVFILDYVWNGTSWEFSFVDTSVSVDNEQPLVENWETDGFDALGNRITRHYVWSNSLAYTDIITETNVDKMASHIVDEYTAPKLVYKYDDNNKGVLYNGASVLLTQNPTETVDDGMPLDAGMVNKSKLFDVSYGHFEVTPKTLTPGEASRWGYNMLSNTPYTFECVNAVNSQTAVLTGIVLKRKDSEEVLLKPVTNTPGDIHIYYQSDFGYLGESDPPFLQLKVEYKNQYDEWRALKDYSLADTHAELSSGSAIKIPFTGADETTLIRVTITDTRPENRVEVVSPEGVAYNQSTGKMEQLTELTFLVVSQMVTTLSYTKDPTKVEPSPEIYDLGSATGMCYWKGRLVLWGVLNAENTLFMSEPNEPEYFAYPNSIDLFEENVVHVIPYSDALIVFTSTKMWRIDMLADGLSWKKTLLQQNLRINDKDIPYIIVLKNMLFFKSDKNFYMVVPARGSTVGDLTIAPVGKAIQSFLKDPFKNIGDILHTVYPELAGNEDYPRPYYNYLVKYGSHTEQNRVVVDWWFDLTDWQNQVTDIGERDVQHDVIPGATVEQTATALNKQYLLLQLVYDAQTYGWTMRWHITDNVGVFIADAVNTDVDFLSLIFSPQTVDSDGVAMFGAHGFATWGIDISHRRATDDAQLHEFSINPNQIVPVEPMYPRFQVFDTGYKETSSPALKKRFREIQIMMEPKPSTKVGPDGDAVGLRAVLLATIDGHTVMSSVSQEVTTEADGEGTLVIKVVDKINYHDQFLLDPDRPPNLVPLPYTVDSELSNTFVLDSSALSGVKLVKVRRAINGKGYLVRMRFTNVTEANYSITGHAFVAHNKNAR